MTSINFGMSNYVRSAPGVPPVDTIMDVPDSGELPICRKDLVFNKDDISVMIPELTEVNGFPTVTLEKPLHGRNDLWMMWIETRGEWIVIFHSNWQESDAWGDDDSYDGPYKPTSYQAAKILEVYEIKSEILSVDDVIGTSPEKLERLRDKHKNT